MTCVTNDDVKVEDEASIDQNLLLLPGLHKD